MFNDVLLDWLDFAYLLDLTFLILYPYLLIYVLGGFCLTPIWGIFQFDENWAYFSDGLKPPTSNALLPRKI